MDRLNKSSKTTLYIDYFITILILLIADNPIVVINKEFKLAVFFFIVLVFIFRNKRFDQNVFSIIVLVLVLLLFQGSRWGFSSFTFFTFTVFVILTPYFTAKVLGMKYLKYTANIVYVISIYSLILYFLQIFIPPFTDFLFRIEKVFSEISSLPVRPSILIYTITTKYSELGIFGNIPRNFGMFHEPGAFAVFIVLAIATNIMLTNRPFSRKNIILIIALLTTFSTAGYISLFLTYALYYYYINRANVKRLVVFSVFAIPAILYTYQLPFMAGKVENQFETQTSQSLNTGTSGRFLGARKSLVVLRRYPLTGRGLISASKETDITSEEAAGYGYMKFFSRLGIPLSILFIYFFTKGLGSISYYASKSKKYILLVAIGLLVNLFSQKFIGDVFFIMIFFIGIIKEYSIKQQALKNE
ncbi:MAG: O-antigen ligase family protein [Bacteroidales bacterium]|nr:O-antigen ligase family protein [Bacteroidales bacterium]